MSNSTICFENICKYLRKLDCFINKNIHWRSNLFSGHCKLYIIVELLFESLPNVTNIKVWNFDVWCVVGIGLLWSKVCFKVIFSYLANVSESRSKCRGGRVRQRWRHLRRRVKFYVQRDRWWEHWRCYL